jgi:Tfp pilus assembly protein PilV
MGNLICDRKGISMMEVLVSVALISVGVLGLVTLLPSGWRLSGTADMLGRAAAIPAIRAGGE